MWASVIEMDRIELFKTKCVRCGPLYNSGLHSHIAIGFPLGLGFDLFTVQ